MGLEVIAIDDTDTTGWLESATTIGQVNFSSIQSFVDNVIAYLNGRKIKLLHLQVHGNTSGVYFKNEALTVQTLQNTHRGVLSRLTPCFDTDDPWVDLRACEIGQNLTFMQALAALWNTTLVAGRGSQNNLYDMNFGRYVTMKPDGTHDTSFFCPSQVEYNVLRRGWRQLTT